MEAKVLEICGSWRSKYYANEVDDDSFAQMKEEAYLAGYSTVLAYREQLLIAAMCKPAATPS